MAYSRPALPRTRSQREGRSGCRIVLSSLSKEVWRQAFSINHSHNCLVNKHVREINLRVPTRCREFCEKGADFLTFTPRSLLPSRVSYSELRPLNHHDDYAADNSTLCSCASHFPRVWTKTPKLTYSTDTAGRTSLAYSPDGKYLMTVGSNEVIRKFTVGSEDEPVTIDDNLGRNVAIVATV